MENQLPEPAQTQIQPKKTANQKKLELLLLKKHDFLKESNNHRKKCELYKTRRELKKSNLVILREKKEELWNAYQKATSDYNNEYAVYRTLSARSGREHDLWYVNKNLLRKTNKEIACLEKIEFMKNYIEGCTKKEKDQDKQEKKENKKNDVLKRIVQLPDEVRNIVQDFLPYKTLFSLIESKYNVPKMIRQMKHENSRTLLRIICMSPEYFSTLTAEEAGKQVFVPGVPFDPDYEFKTVTECKLKIQFILEKMKLECPEFAYKTEKKLSILFGKTQQVK